MTGTQWSALMSISSGHSTTCSELARDLSYNGGAMTRLVDTMEECGWIVRRRDTSDRRVVKLALTATGHELAAKCKEKVIARWNQRLEGWDREKVTTLVSQLQALLEIVETVGGKGTRP
ncbi:MarR family winged helix-turn-helix transcriptional regulator [Sphingobium sp. BS19]|nr:MarR family winged helix-turn-helix transcriptional regulator [Sphingobium sp. BS19]GLJ00238.1 hypothetical protein Sbs19_40550 [Sphingobium sp. BS19]